MRRLSCPLWCFVFILLGSVACGDAGAAVLSDDFNDNSRDGMWQEITENSFRVRVVETDGRLELHATSSSAGEGSYYGSNGWTLDTDHDLKLRVDWRFAVSDGELSWVELGLVVPDFGDWISLAAGTRYDPYWDANRAFMAAFDFRGATNEDVYRSPDSGTIYITYVSATDTLYLSTNDFYPDIPDSHSPGTGNWKYSGLVQGSWGAAGLQLFLGGMASATSLDGNSSYLDDLSLEAGEILLTGSGPVWGLVPAPAEDKEIYRRVGFSPSYPDGTGWKKVPGRLKQLSRGTARLWGVTAAERVYYRLGISETDPDGTGWERLAGFLRQVSVGPDGVVWGVTGTDAIYCRTGVSDAEPMGTGWQKVPGRLAQVSVGPGCAWGVTEGDRIYYRSGVTTSNPTGDSWQRVPGCLDSISVGPTGVVWGTTADGQLYCRWGITGANPTGTGWQRVPGRLSCVSVGPGCAWGCTDTGQIYRRSGVSLSVPKGDAWQRTWGSLSELSAGPAWQ